MTIAKKVEERKARKCRICYGKGEYTLTRSSITNPNRMDITNTFKCKECNGTGLITLN